MIGIPAVENRQHVVITIHGIRTFGKRIIDVSFSGNGKWVYVLHEGFILTVVDSENSAKPRIADLRGAGNRTSQPSYSLTDGALTQIAINEDGSAIALIVDTLNGYSLRTFSASDFEWVSIWNGSRYPCSITSFSGFNVAVHCVEVHVIDGRNGTELFRSGFLSEATFDTYGDVLRGLIFTEAGIEVASLAGKGRPELYKSVPRREWPSNVISTESRDKHVYDGATRMAWRPKITKRIEDIDVAANGNTSVFWWTGGTGRQRSHLCIAERFNRSCGFETDVVALGGDAWISRDGRTVVFRDGKYLRTVRKSSSPGSGAGNSAWSEHAKMLVSSSDYGSDLIADLNEDADVLVYADRNGSNVMIRDGVDVSKAASLGALPQADAVAISNKGGYVVVAAGHHAHQWRIASSWLQDRLTDLRYPRHLEWELPDAASAIAVSPEGKYVAIVTRSGVLSEHPQLTLWEMRWNSPTSLKPVLVARTTVNDATVEVSDDGVVTATEGLTSKRTFEPPARYTWSPKTIVQEYCTLRDHPISIEAWEKKLRDISYVDPCEE